MPHKVPNYQLPDLNRRGKKKTLNNQHFAARILIIIFYGHLMCLYSVLKKLQRLCFQLFLHFYEHRRHYCFRLVHVQDCCLLLHWNEEFLGFVIKIINITISISLKTKNLLSVSFRGTKKYFVKIPAHIPTFLSLLQIPENSK